LDILSLQFLALLLSGILLGGMIYFTAGVAPLIFMQLPREMAGKLIRRAFPIYYGAGAVLSLAASACIAWSFPGLALALTGVAFLFALLWLMPSVNRNREKGDAGDEVASATAKGLHHASVLLNLVQLAAVLLAFAMIATGWI
jgi:hypothetical protein